MKKHPITKIILILVVVCFMVLPLFPPQAEAGTGQMARGIFRTLFSIVEIPKAIVAHSQNTLFPIGVLTGTVAGTFRTVTGTLGGVMDMAAGALPYAKYAAFFV